jgi:hypothetical protein
MTAVAERSHLGILSDTTLSRPGFRDNAVALNANHRVAIGARELGWLA